MFQNNIKVTEVIVLIFYAKKLIYYTVRASFFAILAAYISYMSGDGTKTWSKKL